MSILLLILGLFFLLLAAFALVVTALVAGLPFLAAVMFGLLGIFLVCWALEADAEKAKKS